MKKFAVILFMLFIWIQNFHAQVNSKFTDGDLPVKVFKAGAATCNITPFLGGGIVGNFGTPPPATYIHDELHARCLVLDDGTTQLIFIIADIIGLNRNLTDETKRLIFEQTNIPPRNIMISATHTHSATSAQGVGNQRRTYQYENSFDDYQNFLIKRFTDVVKIALNNLEPARIGWGVGSVPEHVFVRRWKMKPGTSMPNPFGGQDKVVMNPGVGNPDLLEPAGKPDTDVSFISVQSTDGKPIALLANYSLHYVGGVPSGHISADYFGIFADRIQELLKADRQNPPFVGIMTNGTSGDVNNINFRGPAEKNPPYQKMQRVADDVAREVFRVHNKISYKEWVPLNTALEEITLKVRNPDKKMIQYAENIQKQPESVKPYHRHEKAYAERIINLQEWPDQLEIALQTFSIGELGVSAIPFETFAEIGIELKTKSPFKHTFTIELANGSHGYLPTPNQHELGGYETWLGTNRVEKEASVKIVSKLLEMFDNLSMNH